MRAATRFQKEGRQGKAQREKGKRESGIRAAASSTAKRCSSSSGSEIQLGPPYEMETVEGEGEIGEWRLSVFSFFTDWLVRVNFPRWHLRLRSFHLSPREVQEQFVDALRPLPLSRWPRCAISKCGADLAGGRGVLASAMLRMPSSRCAMHLST